MNNLFTEPEKNATDLQSAVNLGYEWCLTPCAVWPPKAGCPYILTSEKSDAWFIGAWAAYEGSDLPKNLKPIRGGYRVEYGWYEENVKVLGYKDHRTDVVRA